MKSRRILSMLLALTVSATSMLTGMVISASTTTDNQNADSQPLKVMSVGDSITDGYWEQGSYRKYTYKLLTDNGYNIDMVGPRGSNSQTTDGFTYDGQYCAYSGYAIQDISGTETRSGIYEVLVNGNVMENYDPDIVLLQIGTNDILSAYNTGIEDRLENLVDYMLGYLEDEEDVLFVTTIPYMDVNEVYSWFWPYGSVYYSMDKSDFCDLIDDYVDIYNQKIEDLVKEKQLEGKHIQLADINSVVDVNTDLNDGVHPNEQGYEKMGEYWYTVLDGYLSGETSNNYSYYENGSDITASIKSGVHSFSDNVVTALKDGSLPITTTTTTTTPVTTTEVITTTTPITTTEVITTTTPVTTTEVVTTTTSVTTTKAVTTTTEKDTSLIDDNCISLPIVNNKVDLSKYLGTFDKVKLTFSDTFNGNGAVCFYTDNTWYGQVSYGSNGTNTITIDVSEYNNAKTGEVVFWYNPTGATLMDVSIITNTTEEVATTTTPVTTTEATTTTTTPITTTEVTTTTTPVTTTEATTTTTTPVTTTEATTTTTPVTTTEATTTTTPVTTTKTTTTTTIPVTTTEATTTTTTTPMTTTEATTTTTTPVTTTETTTTTITSNNDSNYIPVEMNGSCIDVNSYTDKNVVGITFKLSKESTGNGACHLMSDNNSWLGAVDYSFSNQDTVTIDLSKISNIGKINLYMWWNSAGASINDINLIVE